MSLLINLDAVPSRVLAVYRYLLHARGQRESREVLIQVLMPDGLPLKSSIAADLDEDGAELPAPSEERPTEGRDRGMAQRTLAECVGLGLVRREEEDIVLSTNLPPAARDPKSADALAPLTLADLIFNPENDHGHDLARAIAWYLTLLPTDPPAEWTSLTATLQAQAAAQQINKERYGQLREWSSYLGFAWTLSAKPLARTGKAKSHKFLVPDPSQHLRQRLPQVFSRSGESESFSKVLAKLAQCCGVLEGGRFRQAATDLLQLAALPAGTLSPASAHAWLRLHEEGVVQLAHSSDANSVRLPEGKELVPYSEVRWLGGGVA